MNHATRQSKQGGRKLVVTMSSMGGCIGPTSQDSRELQKPLGFADGVIVPYKASKAALNQGTCQSHRMCCMALIERGMLSSKDPTWLLQSPSHHSHVLTCAYGCCLMLSQA